jgi:transketolase
LSGDAGVLVIVGPGVGSFLAQAMISPQATRPEIWVATELPLRGDTLPARILSAERLYVVEEHVAQGGAGQMLAHLLLQLGAAPRHFRHFHARGYPSGTYGSQAFHRIENGIDPATVLAVIANPV